MSVTIHPIALLNTESGQPAPAELWEAVTEQQLADWEAEWMPELFRSIQRMHRAGIERRHWPQHRHWNWRRKADVLQGLLTHQGFSIMCDGVTQGMMFVDVSTHRARIERQRGQHLVYVEFVENAPWNRRELTGGAPRYRGVGSVLIGAAIALSQAEELKGRIGLHSLPQANGFYANTCSMTDMGIDPEHQNLRYFEMTPEQAEAFIQRGEPK